MAKISIFIKNQLFYHKNSMEINFANIRTFHNIFLNLTRQSKESKDGFFSTFYPKLEIPEQEIRENRLKKI